MLRNYLTTIILWNGLAEGEAGTEQPLALHIREDQNKEARLLPLRAQAPSAGLTEQIYPVDEGNVRPVPLREPLYHTRLALFGVRAPAAAFAVVVAADEKVVR